MKGKTWISRQKLLLMFLHHSSSGKNHIQDERKIQSLLNQNSNLSKITKKDIMLSGQVTLRNFVPSGIEIIHNQWHRAVLYTLKWQFSSDMHREK